MRPHQGRAEGKDHLPRPAGHTLLNVPQNAISLLGHEGTLLPHSQPAVHQDCPDRTQGFHQICTKVLWTKPEMVRCLLLQDTAGSWRSQQRRVGAAQEPDSWGASFWSVWWVQHHCSQLLSLLWKHRLPPFPSVSCFILILLNFLQQNYLISESWWKAQIKTTLNIMREQGPSQCLLARASKWMCHFMACWASTTAKASTHTAMQRSSQITVTQLQKFPSTKSPKETAEAGSSLGNVRIFHRPGHTFCSIQIHCRMTTVIFAFPSTRQLLLWLAFCLRKVIGELFWSLHKSGSSYTLHIPCSHTACISASFHCQSV